MKSKTTKRLDSIKAAHESERTRSSSRMEDYLEIISELVELKGYATTLDISRYMNVSAPSVTKMLQRLDENGFLEYVCEGVQYADIKLNVLITREHNNIIGEVQ